LPGKTPGSGTRHVEPAWHSSLAKEVPKVCELMQLLIQQAIEGCRRNGIHSGLCGQAPSDYPEMAEYLVRLGIDSISLNPDTILATTRQVLEIEKSITGERLS
ncbi:putative PEP-binding protein, partial [Candidatus Igneacidithiobacillus taiwanensis]|uniref:putative PEP-binding protein n=1 Tax=Candidatus Igneacidithiobacillus taiwanensis TaxID=1945924 RepID=UPI00289CD772